MITASLRSNSRAEEFISDWLESILSQNSAEITLDLFKCLFIDGSGHSDPKISEIVEELALNKDSVAEREFLRVIDRTCFQLITHWLINDRSSLVSELANLISNITTHQDKSYAKLPRRLSYVWKLYVQHGYFQRLCKLNVIINRCSTDPKVSPVFANLLDRYPFLYAENLLTEDNPLDYLAVIQKMQQQAQLDYEFRFSQYLTYQIRKAILRQTPNQQKVIARLPNPTLIKSRDLGIALQSYVGGISGKKYWDNAYSFQFSIRQQTISLLEFKILLYQYLIQDLEASSYIQEKLQPRLKKYLKHILADNHDQPCDEMLEMHTYNQLLDFLVIDSTNCTNHDILSDLLSNLGATATVGLLLKIILLCPPAKTAVEHRLSILFNRYYDNYCEELPWLIQLLENWQVASSIYFGKVDSSILKQIVGTTVHDTYF